ncbi:MAG: hypothetical protein RXN89_02180 [Vulcanisaeta sp.]|jgi:hypothetical protein|nr:MAG: hypothetical protein AT716_02695 [Vulcanisaeta sp. MG_3]KUO94366.1 MAG: hypothetical protein AT717_00595 [Vulcanisaeta sp. CIS_19]MCG2865101.1 hypothetical protein [Vulcanisaeta sp.]MCG2885193.1 hypothetical protein [Vulcanisaeta sp.]
MMVEIKTFKSINDLIKFLKNELSNEYRFMYMLKQNWQEVFGIENNNVSLASEISERIKFLSDGSETFSLSIVYKAGTNTRSDFVNDVAGYVQRKSAIIKAVIDRLESFDDDTKNKPVTVLLIDSVPMMMIIQS